MKASVLDLRKKMKKILNAIERNEKITLTYRGKTKAIIYPYGTEKDKNYNILEDPAFGMWKNRKEMKNPVKYIKNLRKSRYDI
jgi:antitoxin (DNA-binding transcriptional repressor) of toxin-antitoxin stability system